MTRKEQIEEFIKFHAHKFSVRNGYKTIEELMREMAQWCDNNPKNPWVSVEERLPEKSQIVFVHMQGGSFDSAIYTNGAFERSLQLKFGMKDEGYTIISWEQRFKSNITHWMPIPTLNPAEQLISGLQEMNKQFEKGGK